jgi:transcription antitermination protein NusB
MSLPQRKRREIVFQWLYSLMIQPVSDEEMLPFLMKEIKVSKKNLIDTKETVSKILENKVDIDAHISSVSSSYTIDQIQWVDLVILRLGAFEIIYCSEIPDKVAIAEAIRLAKKFSHPQAISFVNALLDQIRKRHVGEETDVAQVDLAWEDLENADQEGESQNEDSQPRPEEA